MEQVLVIEVVDSVVSQVVSFTGEHDDISSKAEELLLQICRENIWNFDDYTENSKIDAESLVPHVNW